MNSNDSKRAYNVNCNLLIQPFGFMSMDFVEF